MNEIKLWLPNKFSGDLTNKEEVDDYIVQSNKFYANKIKGKLKFRGKIIDFGKYTLDNGFYQQFIHLVTFSEKGDNFFNPIPCKDKIFIKDCKNCIEKNLVFKIKGEDRYFCFYRCEYIVLIVNIFKLINVGNFEKITVLEKEEFVNRKIATRKRIHIRYIDDDIYYYIILEDTSDKGYYSFVCAYPVFNKKARIEIDKMFAKNKKEEN